MTAESVPTTGPTAPLAPTTCAPAAAVSRVVAQARFEAVTLLRNG